MAGIYEGSVTVLTAVPGSGKTLRTVWHIRESLKKKTGTVYVCNLNGLDNTGDLEGWVEFEDPTRWRELPPGSTLVVDEAQRFFRGGERGNNLPDYITAMETIRHAGITLILVTQHPSFLLTHIQKLCTNHEHLVRENGEEACRVYKRSGIMTNVHSQRSMAREDHEKWTYPKELYGRYKSAEVHTVKKTMKSRTKRILIGLAFAAVLVVGAVFLLRGQVTPPEAEANTPAASAAAVFGSRPKASDDEPKWEADPNAPGYRTDYARDHLPRFGTMPWTAPVFDERAVTSDPQIICASSLAGEGSDGQWMQPSCTCLTEQGTLHEITHAECRIIARRGPIYNPYKQGQGGQMQAQQPMQPQPAAVAPSSAALAVPRGSNRSQSFPESPGYACETCEGSQ